MPVPVRVTGHRPGGSLPGEAPGSPLPEGGPGIKMMGPGMPVTECQCQCQWRQTEAGVHRSGRGSSARQPRCTRQSRA